MNCFHSPKEAGGYHSHPAHRTARPPRNFQWLGIIRCPCWGFGAGGFRGGEETPATLGSDGSVDHQCFGKIQKNAEFLVLTYRVYNDISGGLMVIDSDLLWFDGGPKTWSSTTPWVIGWGPSGSHPIKAPDKEYQTGCLIAKQVCKNFSPSLSIFNHCFPARPTHSSTIHPKPSKNLPTKSCLAPGWNTGASILSQAFGSSTKRGSSRAACAASWAAANRAQWTCAAWAAAFAAQLWAACAATCFAIAWTATACAAATAGGTATGAATGATAESGGAAGVGTVGGAAVADLVLRMERRRSAPMVWPSWQKVKAERSNVDGNGVSIAKSWTMAK